MVRYLGGKSEWKKGLENLTWKTHCATQEFLNTWFCEFALEEELDIGKEECVCYGKGCDGEGRMRSRMRDFRKGKYIKIRNWKQQQEKGRG